MNTFDQILDKLKKMLAIACLDFISDLAGWWRCPEVDSNLLWFFCRHGACCPRGINTAARLRKRQIPTYVHTIHSEEKLRWQQNRLVTEIYSGFLPP